MVVRLRLRICKNQACVESTAVVNSGYEADTPQLMVPISIAKGLKQWPPPPEAKELMFDTAGGPLRVWVVPKAIRVKVLVNDMDTKEVEADLVISPLADECLISDLLIDELGIAIESAGKGLWRFRWEPTTKLRGSVSKY